MSLNSLHKLYPIAQKLSRDLRRNSTTAETKLWCNLRNKKILGKRFVRQYPIYYDITGKESFFIPDFYCHECRLAIELDGHYHDYRLKQDKNRTLILNQLGIKVIRFTNKDVINNIGKVLRYIENELGKNPSTGPAVF